MATLPADRRPPWRCEVDAAHDAVLALVAELEELTRVASPDVPRIAGARWKLSQASRARRLLFDSLALPELLKRGRPDHLAKLRALKEQEPTQMAASAQHIANWTMDRIVADWSGYCRASAAMRETLRRRIAAEREMIELL